MVLVNKRVEEKNKMEKRLDFIALMIFSGVMIITLVMFNSLNEMIPLHFGLDGSFSEGSMVPKVGIFGYIALGVVAQIIIQVLIRNREMLMYSMNIAAVKITKENEERQYNLARIYFKALGIGILSFAGFMQLSIVYACSKGLTGIGMFYLLGMIVLIIIDLVYKKESKKIN